MNRFAGAGSTNNSENHKDLVFFIRIQYRQNSSWQGTVQWMDGKKEAIFRSALELGNLINDAKREHSGQQAKPKSGWEDKESAS